MDGALFDIYETRPGGFPVCRFRDWSRDAAEEFAEGMGLIYPMNHYEILPVSERDSLPAVV